jgi:transcriptional regulator with XRE-family HTH domain
MSVHEGRGGADRRTLEPGVQRHRIAAALRRARAEAGITQGQVAKAMDWSIATVIRVEAGTHKIRKVDLEEMLRLYRVSDQLKEILLQIHEDSKRESPYAAFGSAADVNYLIYLQYELSAYSVRNFEPLLVPGLLQTEEYAGAVLEVIEYQWPDKVEPLVDLRMTRQELMTGRETPPPSQMHFILDEAVIRRNVGGPKVMQRQLERLKGFVQHNPQITIQLIPRRRGLYKLCQVPYVLLELPGPEYDYDGTADFQELVLYVEEPLSNLVIHGDVPPGRTDLASPPEYLEVFMELAANIANGREETVRLLDDAINDLPPTPRVLEHESRLQQERSERRRPNKDTG